MITWLQFYESNKNNLNENNQTLWMKYNDILYIYNINSGGRNKIQNNTINNYVEDDYVIDYLK